MKKVINRSLVVIITLISLLVSIKLSKMPLFSFMKNDSFFYTNSDIIEKYSFVYDVSIGFFLSIVFYIVVEHIPIQREIKSGKYIIQKNVNLILENLETIIGLTCQLYGIDNNKELFEEDFLTICGDCSFNDKTISYQTEVFSLSNKRINGVHTYNTFQQAILNSIKAIRKEVENIKKNSLGYKYSTEFLKVLSEIETNEFLRIYENKEIKLFIYADTDAHIYDLYKLSLKFIYAKYHSNTYKIRLDKESETKEYIGRVNSGYYINGIIEYHNRKEEWCAKKHPLIIYDKNDKNYYVAKYIIRQVSLYIKAIELKEICEEEIHNSQLIIDITSTNVINNYKLPNDAKVFCFYPKRIMKKNTNYTVITYTKPLIIFNKHINGNHPNRKDIDMLIGEIKEYINSKTIKMDV